MQVKSAQTGLSGTYWQILIFCRVAKSALGNKQLSTTELRAEEDGQGRTALLQRLAQTPLSLSTARRLKPGLKQATKLGSDYRRALRKRPVLLSCCCSCSRPAVLQGGLLSIDSFGYISCHMNSNGSPSLASHERFT